MRLQQLYNTVNIQVRNAAFAVQQDVARVKAAQATREYASQSLDAEQKKYALGASTSTLVLQNQSAFETAENTLVAALDGLRKTQSGARSRDLDVAARRTTSTSATA